MKNIKLFIAVLSALVLTSPIISSAEITNVSGSAVPAVSPTIRVMPAETKSVSTSNATTKCGVNTFSVSNECGAGAFKNSYVQCYDGYVENQGGESSCKSSSLWQEYAKNICTNHCATTNTTTEPYIPSTNSSAGQNIPVNSVKIISPEISATTATTKVISVCYIGDDLMKQYDTLISELNASQANGEKDKSDVITQKIIELKKQITASKEKCNNVTTQSQPSITIQQSPTVSSATVSAPVEINRCNEVKRWQDKIAYYQNLNGLNDADLKNKTGLSKDEIKNALSNLEEGIQKVKEQCNLQSTTSSASSASSQAIIAEPVKPVAIQSAQEINTYYKAKIENTKISVK